MKVESYKEEIQEFFKGEIESSSEVLEKYSKDASLLQVRPQLVVFPKDSEDLQKLVQFVNQKRGEGDKEISLTVRAAGSCMSGGSLNESIIADVTRHMNKMGEVDKEARTVVAQPGVLYKDFELRTLNFELIFPVYPASKNLAAIGGMVANNCAGEKTLRYGKMEDFVLESKVIFADGHEYVVRPLNKAELEQKVAQDDFEGNLYKNLYSIILQNNRIIKEAKPTVSKNSAGYYLWNVCLPDTQDESLRAGDEEKEIFDLNKLIVGSQGTLGIVTEAKLRLVPVESVSKLYVIFLPGLEHLAEIVNEILPTNPESLESYDDATLKLAFRFFPEMLRTMKVKHFAKLLLSFIPEGFMMLRSGFPKLVVLVEYAGKTEKEVDEKLEALDKKLAPRNLVARSTISQEESEKYWTIRRESFNLLRKHVKGRRTAPFVDDVVVHPSDMPEFLPKMREILDSYKLTYTIAGHAGNGNFHIIPLMDMHKKENIEVIKEVGEKVYNLVAQYGGSITGEHNDGLIRTPYLDKMFSSQILDLFAETKHIFDPHNIFNPGKKVPAGDKGTIEYLSNHIAVEQ